MVLGDFRQLLPVKINATRYETVNLSIKYSSLWSHFRKLRLTQNRQIPSQEQEFSRYLLDAGDGILNDPNNNLKLPERCIDNSDIVEYIYGKMIRKRKFTDMTKSAIISARNADVEEIFKKIVDLLDIATEKTYTNVDTIENCDNGEIGDAILPEHLITLNPPNFPPY